MILYDRVNITTLTAEVTGIPVPVTVDNYDFTELTVDARNQAKMSLGAEFANAASLHVCTVLLFSAGFPPRNRLLSLQREIDHANEKMHVIGI